MTLILLSLWKLPFPVPPCLIICSYPTGSPWAAAPPNRARTELALVSQLLALDGLRLAHWVPTAQSDSSQPQPLPQAAAPSLPAPPQKKPGNLSIYIHFQAEVWSS